MTKKSNLKKKVKYGEVVNSVLDFIADQLIDFGNLAFYGPKGYVILGKLIKYFVLKRKEAYSKQAIDTAIRRLKNRKILKLEKKGNKVFVKLEEKGKVLILKHSIKKLLEFKKKKKKWDGRWFLVFFDVPEIKKNNREYLRKFLKEIGFHRYQKSVYIYPYECKTEVELIKKIIEGANYLKYIVAEKIEDEERFLDEFGLK